MTRNIQRSILILLTTGGCSVRQPPIPGAPVPAPSQRIEGVSDNPPWAFAYRADTVRVQVSRSAAIESQTDSGTHREISTNNSHEIIVVAVDSDAVRYTATIDSFSTASQGQIGNVQPVKLPAQTAGVIGSTVLSDSTASSCDPVQAALETDVRNLLVSFPQQLAPAQTWRDSVVRFSCYGSIPMRTTVVRIFSVVGRTALNGQRAVAIQRTDSISAHGEGQQKQHRLVVDTKGTGTSTYYLIPEQGRVLHLTTSQDLDFTVRASGRTSRFRENAKEEFSPVP
jgi:hypothetical protein